jgi:hypothetical protein
MKTAVSIILLLVIVGLTACAPTWVTTSEPAIQYANNAVYKLALEPRKKGFNYYSFFNLTITNISETPIEIDWNRSLYLFNDKPARGFIFQGVTADQIKAGTIPMDTVLPGAEMTKNIAPLRLITWAPVRDKSVTPKGTRYNAGAMPDGKNGVLLYAIQDGKTLRQAISVSIQSEKAN